MRVNFVPPPASVQPQPTLNEFDALRKPRMMVDGGKV